MKKYAMLFILFVICSAAFSQKKYRLPVAGGVDTIKTDIKAVYELFNNYLNDSPDSVHFQNNPYWDKEEVNYYLNRGLPYFDESAGLMYRNLSAKEHLSFYEPKILSIDEIRLNLYAIRTLYYNETYSKDKIYGRWNPPYITKHYCKKEGEKFFLKNSIGYETEYWNKYQYEMLHYFVHPNLIFDKKQAENAVDFVKKTCEQYDLPIPERIDYYCTGTREELVELLNFSYLLSYMDGVTNKFLNRIIVKNDNFDHTHELTHIIFDKPEWNKESRPLIVNEGLATFLGGADGETTFSENLKEWAEEVVKADTLKLEDIINNKYRHLTDNKPVYVTGGYIFKAVYEKHKEKGVIKLFNCGKEKSDFTKTIEELFDMPYDKFNVWILEQIKKE
ncbi:MAG: hypothetical protein CSB55_04545 [Candidatus Cloacimonadota bacterium]|nr:MAG: hypothetical protein CSB55_04545 [Candidatus Cloacimonadota bacterium]